MTNTPEIPTLEAVPPYYVKFEEDNTKVRICQGGGNVLDYNWSERVTGLGFIPVIMFRKAFAELGKTGICGEDAMFQVPWQAAQGLKMTVEIFDRCSKEQVVQMLRETDLLMSIDKKNWEKVLDILSVFALAKKLEVKGVRE